MYNRQINYAEHDSSFKQSDIRYIGYELKYFQIFFHSLKDLSLNFLGNSGSGGGTRGRAMALSLGRPGSNPSMGLGFFLFRIAVYLFSLGVRLL